MRARISRGPRFLIRQAALAMQRAAKVYFRQGKEKEFSKAARLMEEINRFYRELDKRN